MKKCYICDYYRLVLECGVNNQHTKKEAAIRRRDATVCVKPESPFYGQHRGKGSCACGEFKDWFYHADFNGERDAVRAAQTALVDKYRIEVLGLMPLGKPGIAP